MFKGQFTYSLDGKGRLSIPAKMRKDISADALNTFVMTRGSAQCIDLLPLNVWDAFELRLKERLNPYNPEHMRFQRHILQYATEDTMDAQSRILIPQNLLKLAGIEKEVLILGQFDKIELWNPGTFSNYIDVPGENFEELAAKVMAP